MKFNLAPIITIFTFCLIAQNSFALVQKDTVKTNTVTVAPVEVLPQFPGGQEKLTAFIKSKLHPVKGASGKVLVYFVVEKTGKLNHIKVIKGLSAEANKEAVRVIKLSPKWKPGTQNGVVRRIAYTTPVIFS
ncbi:energy transducer TonB [Mucilaginibacter sp. AW1-7]|jgi:protein TonB|uniref:energy transducer TonB n=1 Tax=unclassified Mucilaginibacter TaxID=2617802 RepID=UPI0008CB1EEF|nr:energy transducer TonB [Mucilaginibacter sp. OK283]SEP22361.1 protein TonB [Mucilaginibacter sp. OK283]